MTVKKTTAVEADPDCLHCYLPSIIDAWQRSHPQVSLELILIQVAQTLGELVGSFAPDPACADRLAVGLLRYVRENAREIATAVEPGVH